MTELQAFRLASHHSTMAPQRKAAWTCSKCRWHHPQEHHTCHWCDKRASEMSAIATQPMRQTARSRTVTSTSPTYAAVAAQSARPRQQTAAAATWPGWIDYSDDAPMPQPASSADGCSHAESLHLQCVLDSAAVKFFMKQGPLAASKVEEHKQSLKEHTRQIALLKSPESQLKTLQVSRDRKCAEIEKNRRKQAEKTAEGAEILNIVRALNDRADYLLFIVEEIDADMDACRQQIEDAVDLTAVDVAEATPSPGSMNSNWEADCRRLQLLGKINANMAMQLANALVVCSAFDQLVLDNPAEPDEGEGAPTTPSPTRVLSTPSPSPWGTSSTNPITESSDTPTTLALVLPGKRRDAPAAEQATAAKRHALEAAVAISDDEAEADDDFMCGHDDYSAALTRTLRSRHQQHQPVSPRSPM